jgi:hypothetical protein
MGAAAAKEKLKFVMPCITKTMRSESFAMAGITIRNGLTPKANLDGKLPFCYKECVSRRKPGAPPKGSSFGSRKAATARSSTRAFRPGRVGITRDNASETFAHRVKADFRQRSSS